MIWRWLIFSSLLLAGAHATEIEGRIILRDSREASVRKDQDFSGVVISLERLDAGPPIDGVKHARMVQKDKTFTPHVLPVQAGTPVDFPNFDPIFHNAFSRYNGQIFDVGLYPPGSSRTVRFTRPGVVRVFCNIHPSMSAIIVVLNTPYYTRTAKDGRFSLDVPPGKYELRVFHERAAEQTLAGLARPIVVNGGAVEIPALTISEAGYLSAPHKNKYDRPYPPQSDDGTVYPGARK